MVFIKHLKLKNYHCYYIDVVMNLYDIVYLVCRNCEQCWVCMVRWEFVMSLLLNVAESDMDCLLYMWKAVERAVLSTVFI